MSRDFQINGPTLVSVKGPSNTAIGTIQQLGLSTGPISVTVEMNHDPLVVDAYGKSNTVDLQWMGGAAVISMNLIHFDTAILDVCVALSMGGAPTFGSQGQAGQRLGNNTTRFAPGNSFIGLNLTSPVGNQPYCFLFSYLANMPFSMTLGTEKTLVQLNWRAVPFTTDPYNGGLGSYGQAIWTNTLDT